MIRIGQSTDIHRFAENRKLVLGGVEIPYEKGLLGHSDADALTHAVAEAILGALALGDLVGLDVCLAIMDVLYNETGDTKYRASSTLRKYVRAGWLGRKTGRGFYNYNA